MPDPFRRFAAVNYRTAKGSFDKVIGDGEQFGWHFEAEKFLAVLRLIRNSNVVGCPFHLALVRSANLGRSGSRPELGYTLGTRAKEDDDGPETLNDQGASSATISSNLHSIIADGPDR